MGGNPKIMMKKRTIYYEFMNLNRFQVKNRTKTTIFSSLLLQVVSIICAFILPRLILSSFGSEYNGIIHSVEQFLACVVLLRAGVGGVTRAALYKTLSNHDTAATSAIIWSTERFMRRIAIIFASSLVIFASIYPLLVKEEFTWLFSFSLVLTLGITTVIQYAFGITYQFLLHADQRLYVYNFLQTLAVLLNTIFSAILINLHVDIRLVKLASAAAFAVPPLFMYAYVRKHYELDRTVPPDDTAISQRWDAFAHQVAAFIHLNTDFVILTVFSSLYEVSVYSIYNMVVNGIKNLIFTCSSAIEALFGKMLALSEKDALGKRFEVYEFVINVLSLILLGCVAILIVPFIMIYTRGITDAQYYRPIFGCLLSLATFYACIRLPYQNVIEAAGHFKQTRNGAIIEASINLLSSFILVRKFGCEGVAVGTILAMLYRTIEYGRYASRHILNRSVWIFAKRMLVSMITMAVGIASFYICNAEILLSNIDSYWGWLLAAAIVFVFVSIIVLTVNFIFYPHFILNLLRAKIHKHKE